MDMRLMDHAHGYGLVSRFFHWIMALLLLWQAVSAVLHYVAGDAAITDFFFGYHFSNGVLLLILVLLRGLWGLTNLSRRPAHTGGVHRAAAIGHIAMYGLLIAVPVIAVIRSFGSTRPFSALGVPLFSAQPTEIEWMTALGNQWHGFLGWVLFALIAGHILMAFVHTYAWKEPMITRMTRGDERR